MRTNKHAPQATNDYNHPHHRLLTTIIIILFILLTACTPTVIANEQPFPHVASALEAHEEGYHDDTTTTTTDLISPLPSTTTTTTTVVTVDQPLPTSPQPAGHEDDLHDITTVPPSSKIEAELPNDHHHQEGINRTEPPVPEAQQEEEQQGTRLMPMVAEFDFELPAGFRPIPSEPHRLGRRILRYQTPVFDHRELRKLHLVRDHVKLVAVRQEGELMHGIIPI